MTFEQRRQALLKQMSAQSPHPPIKKVIPFRNDDAPRYLRKLDEFERQSRNANLVVSPPVEDVERAAAPLLNDPRPVEDGRDEQIPRLGRMRFGQVVGLDAKMESAGVRDLQMVVLHGHGDGSAGHAVVPVAQRVGDGFTGRTGGIPRPVLAYHRPRAGCETFPESDQPVRAATGRRGSPDKRSGRARPNRAA